MTKIHHKHPYNVKISRLDPQHLRLKNFATPHASLPAMVDLSSKLPICYDQGNLGSCTANALAGASQYLDPTTMISRLFLYYNERKLEHDIPDDAGAELHDGVTCMEKYGDVPESEWPYDVSQFATKPPAKCYTDALKSKVKTASNLANDLSHMKGCLSTGYPFVVGISVYESFESDKVAQTGVVPMPAHDEKCLGAHAVLVVGYNDGNQQFKVRNSWGTNWGDHGHFYLPYVYLLDSNLSSDLWVITLLTPQKPTPPTPHPLPTPVPPTPHPSPVPSSKTVHCENGVCMLK